MSKRISISPTTFAAFIFAVIGLFPVVATAQDPGEPQQGAINTTRSNRKNTSRTTGEVMVVLNEVSGKKVASCRLTHVNNSDAESAFDCGVPAEGNHVLTVRIGAGIIDDLNGLIRRQDGKVDSVKSDLTARVVVTGPVDGKIQKDWKLPKPKDATSASQRSGGLGSQVHQLSIPLKTDGMNKVEGKIIFQKAAN